MSLHFKHLILLVVASMALAVTDTYAVNVNFTVEEMVNPLNTLDPPAVPDFFISEDFVRNDGTILGAMNVGGDFDFLSQRIINGVTFLPSAVSTNTSTTYTSANTGGIYDSGITIGYEAFSDLGAGNGAAAVTGGTAHGFDPTAGLNADFRRLMRSQVRSGRGVPDDPVNTGKTEISVSGLTSGLSYRVQLLVGTNSSEDRLQQIVQGTTETDPFWVGWTQVSASCSSCGPQPSEGNSISVLAEFTADASSIDFTVQPINGHRSYLNAIIVSEIQALGLPGDFDADQDVDGQDFLLWQRDMNVGSLSDWQSNFGSSSSSTAITSAVPEPSAAVLFGIGSLALLRRRRKRKS